MQLDFSVRGKVSFLMDQLTKGILNSFIELIERSAAMPESDLLFEIRPGETRNLLPEEQARKFHHLVVWLLFLGTKVKSNICTAVAFLTI